MSTKQNIYLQLAGVVKSDERAIRVLQRSKTSQQLGSGTLTDIGAAKQTQARRLKDHHNLQWQQAELPPSH